MDTMYTAESVAKSGVDPIHFTAAGHVIVTADEYCVIFSCREQAPPGAVNVYVVSYVGATVCLFPLRQSIVVPVVLLTRVK